MLTQYRSAVISRLRSEQIEMFTIVLPRAQDLRENASSCTPYSSVAPGLLFDLYFNTRLISHVNNINNVKRKHCVLFGK